MYFIHQDDLRIITVWAVALIPLLEVILILHLSSNIMQQYEL